MYMETQGVQFLLCCVCTQASRGHVMQAVGGGAIRSAGPGLTAAEARAGHDGQRATQAAAANSAA